MKNTACYSIQCSPNDNDNNINNNNNNKRFVTQNKKNKIQLDTSYNATLIKKML